MKKEICLICGVMMMLAGCGNEDRYMETMPVTVTKEEMDTYMEELALNEPNSANASENGIQTDKVSENDVKQTESENVAAQPGDEEITVPREYEDAVYGTAPLSSVYLLITCLDDTKEDVTVLNTEEYIEELDQMFGITTADENIRKEHIEILLGLSGLCPEEKIPEFFNGSWVPQADRIYESRDTFEREHAKETTVNGKQYLLWVEDSSFETNDMWFGTLIYVFYEPEGGENTLTADQFQAKYVGTNEEFLITGIDQGSAEAEDKSVIMVSYRTTDDLSPIANIVLTGPDRKPVSIPQQYLDVCDELEK